MMYNEGLSIVYCEGSINTPCGRLTAELIRFTNRYEIFGIIDSRYDCADSGYILNGSNNGILVYENLGDALSAAHSQRKKITQFIFGFHPKDGSLSYSDRKIVIKAIRSGLDIDSPLLQEISVDNELLKLARKNNVFLRDIRFLESNSGLNRYCNKIDEVKCPIIAVFGTEGAREKRPTAWRIKNELKEAGVNTTFVGTGLTSWFQGADYSVILKSIIGEFVSGELEHTIWSAWSHEKPDAIVIEGQGILTFPRFPGNFEILTTVKPAYVVLQHSSQNIFSQPDKNNEIKYLQKYIQIINMFSESKVLGIVLDSENSNRNFNSEYYEDIQKSLGVPIFRSGDIELISGIKNRIFGEPDDFLNKSHSRKFIHFG